MSSLIIRWLGAYAEMADDSLQFETNPKRPVSAEPCPAGYSSLDSANVGLVVDTEQTELLYAANQDLYVTYDSSNRGWRGTKQVPYPELFQSAETWQEVESMIQLACKHGECIIRNPVYKAVAVHKFSDMELAEKVAEYFGIPVIEVPHSSDHDNYIVDVIDEHGVRLINEGLMTKYDFFEDDYDEWLEHYPEDLQMLIDEYNYETDDDE